MSSTAARLRPPGVQAQPTVPAGQGATLGLASATGLVMGTIVGVGVFTMPAVPASAGTCSLAVLAPLLRKQRSRYPVRRGGGCHE